MAGRGSAVGSPMDPRIDGTEPRGAGAAPGVAGPDKERPECPGCGSYVGARARFCAHCGRKLLPDLVLPRREPEDALRFLRMAIFALIVSATVFPPLFRAYQPPIAREINAWVQEYRTLLARLFR